MKFRSLHKKRLLIAAITAIFLIFAPLTLQHTSVRTVSIAPVIAQTTGRSLPLGLSSLFSLRINNVFAANGVQSALGTTSLNFFSCMSGGNTVTCALYFISIFINSVLSLFVALGAYLVRIGLTFNDRVFDSPSIQIGFGISLALANLGFVLGIIIVAIATILRRESYGIKSILWKLIVMAILVNFGLVITRPIVAFSQGISNYFLQSSVGDYTGATSGILDYSNFVANITNAFAPQAYTAYPPGSAQDTSTMINNHCNIPFVGAVIGPSGPLYSWNDMCSDLSKLITGKDPQDLFWQTLLSLVFSMIFVSFAAIALLALAILLLVRYVYIGILLILLPLAWLAWVFPQFSGEFKKWWTNFIKWTFFLPLAIFFIYLALQTATLQANTKADSFINQVTQPSSDTNNAPETTLAVAIGQVSPIQQAADGVILIGLMMGGLMAASSLAGKAGSTVVGGAKMVGNWIGGKAGGLAKRQGKKAASRMVPENFKQQLQQGRLKIIPKRLQVAAGIGLSNVEKAGTSALVDQDSAWAKEQAKDVDTAGRILGSGGLSETKKFALLKALNDNKKFDPTKIRNIDGQNISDFLQDGNRFGAFGQGGLRDDLNKSINGASSATVDAKAALKAGGKNATTIDKSGLLGEVGATVSALSLFNKSIEKTARNMEKGDLKKQNLNYMYSSKTLTDPNQKQLRIDQLRALIKTNSKMITPHLSLLPDEQRDNFEKLLHEAIGKEREDKSSSEEKLAKIEESFAKAMTHVLDGFGNEPEAEKAEEKSSPEEKKK